MTRDERIEAHVDLCRLHAGWIYRRIRGRIPLDDLVQYGMVGLCKAADAFDASRGVRFRTFADRRVKGAILDGIRAETKSRDRVQPPPLFSLEALRADNGSPFDQMDPAPLPDVLADVACVWRLMAELPERAQRIIRLYYGDEDLSDRQIAARFGLTPGRIAQIRTQAIQALVRKQKWAAA